MWEGEEGTLTLQLLHWTSDSEDCLLTRLLLYSVLGQVYYNNEEYYLPVMYCMLIIALRTSSLFTLS